MGGGGGGSSYNPIDKPKTDLSSSDPDTDSPDCSEISFQTNLSSPDPDVLEEVTSGDILSISLASKSGPLVAVHEKGTVGSISHYLFKDIIDCIEAEHTFEAKVLSISSGNCQISVYFVS
ncbi:MAG: hypothetical protein WD607_11150 [Candidatus Paceibacterota bacterium]